MPKLLVCLLFAILAISVIATAFMTTGVDRGYGQPAPADLDSVNNNTLTAEEIPSANASIIVDANNQFALDFYSSIANNTGNATGDENIFFSPWSISNAFAIAYEGARGETAKEIESVFYFPNNTEQRRSQFLQLNNGLDPGGNNTNANYTLTIANGLWVHEGYKISDEYIDAAEQYYNSEVANIDLTSAEGVNTVNQWVEAKTNGKIKNLLSPDAVDELTRLAITNAVYFNGTWSEPFDESKTEQEDFYVNGDETIKAEMMKLDQTEFNYTETEELQVLEMPYEGGKLSMLVLLPRNTSSIQALEESLSLENLARLKGNLTEEQVIVEVPKFKLDTRYDLVETLADMGMPSAFAPYVADFTGITQQDEMYVKAAVHKAFVNVNEKGTEAAAATGITVNLTSAPADPPPVYLFRADRPFVFMIQDNETGNILFMGKIVEPQSE